MIIGIGGSSNSGKSHLARSIIENLKDIDIVHLCQDDFVKYSGNLTKYRSHTDWELPSTIKIDDYFQAVLIAEKDHDIVIAEGLFAFYFKELYNLYSLKIYMNLNRETFFSRKRKDDRWGIEPYWYIEHIWDSHQKYGKGLLKPPYLLVEAGKEINITGISQKISDLYYSETKA